MDFGIWIEPEMVNPDSELYSRNPDWVLNFPNRPRTTSRNQLILNLAREDVADFVYYTVHNLLSDSNIKFLKWDMNRPVFEAGWAQETNQRKMWFDYVQNLYKIWRELKQNHPHVIMESCAGGGGRTDIGIMRYADQFWTSDNTDPYDRQYIQEGFSLCYSPKVMMGWVTDWGGKESYSLEYRFHASMMGSLGIGADLSAYSEKELSQAKELIAKYKQIRDTIQNGRLYRLMSPRKTDFTVNQFISLDGSQVILLSLKNPRALSMFKVLRIKLKGLCEKGIYRIKELERDYSGSYLMNRGLDIDFKQELNIKANNQNHFKSNMLTLTRV